MRLTARTGVALVAALLVLTAVAPGVALGAVSGNPNLDVTLSDNTLAPGEDGRLTFTVSNTGEIITGASPTNPTGYQAEQRVMTARGLTVSVDDEDLPLDVTTNAVSLGSLPDGAAAPAAFGVSVDADAEPGTYTVPVEVSYTYTKTVAEQGERTQIEETVTRTIDVEVVIEDAADVAITDVSTSLAVGETGEVRLTYTNEGSATAHDATVTVASNDGTFTFGGAPTADVYLGDLEPGASETVTLTATLAATATDRDYVLRSTVAYEDDDGIPVQERLTTGVSPGTDQPFSIVATDATLSAGDPGQVTLTLRNEGNEPLGDATVTLQSRNAALALGGGPSATAYVGEWGPGETRTVTVGAALAATAEPGSYPVDVSVGYETAAGTSQRTGTVTTGVTATEGDGVGVVSTDATVAVGDSGTVTVTLRNDAGVDLSDAAVTIQSSNAALTFGGAPTARAYVGEWGAGETQALTFETNLAPTAESRSYAVDLTVTYERPGVSATQTDRATTGITPAAEQGFRLEGVQTSLNVGEDGSVSGTVVNEGPGDIENAVVVLQTSGRTLDVLEPEYAVGDLAAGSSAGFDFDVDVSAAAGSGPKQFTLTVRYEDDDGTTRTSDPLYARGEIGPQRDQFAVEPVDTQVSAGGSTTITMRVTNQGDEPVTDISAKLFTDDPISTSDDEAFIDELGPGESAEMTFAVSAAGSALEKPYPVSVDFQFTDADGDTQLTDTFRVPVDVTAADDSGGFFSITWLTAALGRLFGLLAALAGQATALGAAAYGMAGRDLALVAAGLVGLVLR